MAIGKSPAPLAGKRVIEFGTGYVGPVASMYLGLLGAEVVKIENRGNPDFMRGDVRSGHGITASFVDVNRGKRSIAIDAKSGEGRMLILRLLERADVLVENFGGGALRRLGLSYAEVRTARDDIVMASLQGLGADVELSTTLGQNLPPLIGLTHLWNHPGAAKPVGSELFHPDYYAGVFSAALILAALDDRRRTGKGHFIDCAQAEVAAALLGPWYLACQANAAPPGPVGNRGLRGVPAGCFPCDGDDLWCVIVVHDDAEWRGLKAAIGAADWLADSRFDSIMGRLRNRAALEAALAAWTRTQPAPELMKRLQAQGVPCGAVQHVAALVNDGQLVAQGFVQPLDQAELKGARIGGVPLAFDGIDIAASRRCPVIGEHTVGVLTDWLDLPAGEIARLETERVVEAARPPDA